MSYTPTVAMTLALSNLALAVGAFYLAAWNRAFLYAAAGAVAWMLGAAGRGLTDQLTWYEVCPGGDSFARPDAFSSAVMGLHAMFWELAPVALFLRFVRRGRHPARGMAHFGLGAAGAAVFVLRAVPAWTAVPALLRSEGLPRIEFPQPLLYVAGPLLIVAGAVTLPLLFFAGTVRPSRAWWAILAALAISAGVASLDRAWRPGVRPDPFEQVLFVVVSAAAYALAGGLAWLALRQVRAHLPATEPEFGGGASPPRLGSPPAEA
jgi:hypothetical protein